MKQLPPVELLNSTHQFPGPFVLKVVGKAEDGFLGRVVATAREKSGLPADPAFTVRQSTTGKHVSVTVSIDVKDAEQVLEIYSALSNLQGLELLL